MYRRDAGNSIQRAAERLDRIFASFVGAGLHVRLVYLNDVGAGREQVLDFFVDRGGVVGDHLLFVPVKDVLGLLRHGEGAGDGHLDFAIGVGAEELDVAHLHRMLAPDFADDTRHDVGLAAAIDARAGSVDVNTLQRGGEAVGVTFAAHLAVGDDVEAGALLIADGQQGGVVLGFLEPLGGY